MPYMCLSVWRPRVGPVTALSPARVWYTRPGPRVRGQWHKCRFAIVDVESQCGGPGPRRGGCTRWWVGAGGVAGVGALCVVAPRRCRVGWRVESARVGGGAIGDRMGPGSDVARLGVGVSCASRASVSEGPEVRRGVMLRVICRRRVWEHLGENDAPSKWKPKRLPTGELALSRRAVGLGPSVPGESRLCGMRLRRVLLRQVVDQEVQHL